MTHFHRNTILVVSGLLLAMTAAAKQEILKPEQAFRYDVSSADGAILVTWTIEPGHYLYKERMSYSTTTAGALLGEPELPPGKKYTDEFFGDMHIYRGDARVRIPVIEIPAGGTVDLSIRSQGCADIGLCYPPQTWTASVDVAAAGVSNIVLTLPGGSGRAGPE